MNWVNVSISFPAKKDPLGYHSKFEADRQYALQNYTQDLINLNLRHLNNTL